MTEFQYPIGADITVEVSGKVIEHRRNSRGDTYIVKPHNRLIPIVHAPVATVFPPDDSEPVAAVVGEAA